MSDITVRGGVSLPEIDRSTPGDSVYGEPVSSGWIGGGVVEDLKASEYDAVGNGQEWRNAEGTLVVRAAVLEDRREQWYDSVVRHEIVETIEALLNRSPAGTVLGWLVRNGDVTAGEVAALAQMPVETAAERLDALSAVGLVDRDQARDLTIYRLNR